MTLSGSGDTFFGLDPSWSDPGRSRVVILPVPYERTTSYGKGTSRAPEAILRSSRFLELYDEEMDEEIFRLSGGIATLVPLSFPEQRSDAEAVEMIRAAVNRLLEAGKTVVSLGGEHTIAIGAAQAHVEQYRDISILQLDAHSDLRQEYEGNRYSHACTMARIYEIHPHIVQVGIRSQCREEAEFIREKGIKTFYDVHIKQGRYGAPLSWHDAVIKELKENVYLTFDCDFLDPSLMPALGTPEPGGFGWDETLAFLRSLVGLRNVVGFDINELAPTPAFFHPQFTIAKLMYKLIGYIFRKHQES